LPIIALSPPFLFGGSQEVLCSREVGYIAKPIDPEALANLVLQQVMARRNG